MRPLRFVPYDQTVGTPNVVVDGSPNAGTRLTLSHWPGSPTPSDLRDDLSTQIALHALARPELFRGIRAVTNNHFDQDGLAGVFALEHADLARQHRGLLIDVARAGDFGTFQSRDAARIAMTIAALDDDERSPLPADVLAATYPQRCAALYEWALPRFADLLSHPERWRDLWADEDDHLSAGLLAIESGRVQLDERDEIAVFTIDERQPHAASRFTVATSEHLHPMAMYRNTDRLLIAVITDRRYRLECRYETWVMLTSRVVTPRRDLRTLAEELTALEPQGARWRADAPSALTPFLQLERGDESGLTPAQWLETVERHLRTAPAAWNPLQPD